MNAFPGKKEYLKVKNTVKKTTSFMKELVGYMINSSKKDIKNIVQSEESVTQKQESVKEEVTQLEKSVTFLVVAHGAIKALNQSTQVWGEVNPIIINRKPFSAQKKYYDYYDMDDLTWLGKIQVFLQKSDGKLEKVELPNDMLDKIAEYLRTDTHIMREDIDCNKFAHFVNGIPLGENIETGDNVVDIHKWNVEPITSEEDLQPGDSLFWSNGLDYTKEHAIRHYGVYLGRGLCLSKMGQGIKLGVSTIEDLKRTYVGEYAFKITPKSKYIEKDIEL